MGLSGAKRVFDVVVAGGGVAGLALAACLKQAVGADANILIADPRLGESEGRERALAIAPGSRRLLTEIGVWENVVSRAQPIREMAIMDGGVNDGARPVHLTFRENAAEPLAHMAMNADIVAALRDRALALGVETVKAGVSGFTTNRYTIDAIIGGVAARTRLLVGADGARSKLRAFADIATIGWDYRQSAIVATIAHEREHNARAEQHFLPAGPFAILPLPGRRSSIVWNESRADAAALLSLDRADFHRELEARFTLKLGEIEAVSQPIALPLVYRVARRFIAERLALVGDAAHVVHPLAGQGLNLALRDVASLAEHIVERMRLGLDPGDAENLAAYERARRFDVAASGLGMDLMNRLFSNDSGPVRASRDFGLRLVDLTPSLKRLLIEEAAGVRGAAPRLLLGQAL
ncbi:MAG TPA: FAD-dependent monooxygenase [Roseiarcus sp.]|nr:FAD-dependent monooxygenase [Roseiarcus sp.]